MKSNDFQESNIAGKYRIIRKLSQGSFGAIYHAYNVFTNENLAIKFVLFVHIRNS